MTLASNLYYKNNRLQKIRGFYYTAQLGSLTKAAKAMGLTQPAISQQISSLEKELGMKLFIRQGTTLTLTKEGVAFYTEAVPVMKSIDHLFEGIEKTQQSQKQSILRIAANNATLSYILPSALQRYRAKMPGIKTRIHHAHRQEGLQLLRDKTVDLFMTPRWRELMALPEFEYTPFAKFIPSLITPPNHPLAGKRFIAAHDIAEHELCIAPLQYSVIPGIEDFFERHNLQKKQSLELIGWETPRKFAEKGLGIWISNNIMLEAEDSLVATPLLHYFPMTDYGFVTMRGQHMDDIAQCFTQILPTLYPGGICTHGLTIPLEELRQYF